MNLRHLIIVFLQLVDQLCDVQLAVRPPSFDNLALFLKGKVCPFKRRPDMLLEKGKDFIVRDCTGVGEVVDSSVIMLCKQNTGRKQVCEESVGLKIR